MLRFAAADYDQILAGGVGRLHNEKIKFLCSLDLFDGIQRDFVAAIAPVF